MRAAANLDCHTHTDLCKCRSVIHASRATSYVAIAPLGRTGRPTAAASKSSRCSRKPGLGRVQRVMKAAVPILWISDKSTHAHSHERKSPRARTSRLGRASPSFTLRESPGADVLSARRRRPPLGLRSCGHIHDGGFGHACWLSYRRRQLDGRVRHPGHETVDGRYKGRGMGLRPKGGLTRGVRSRAPGHDSGHGSNVKKDTGGGDKLSCCSRAHVAVLEIDGGTRYSVISSWEVIEFVP